MTRVLLCAALCLLFACHAVGTGRYCDASGSKNEPCIKDGTCYCITTGTNPGTPVDFAGTNYDATGLVTGCQLMPQAGCPQGYKCTTHDLKTTVCDPVNTVGSVVRGGPCTTNIDMTDNCVAGSYCEKEGTGFMCRQFCNATSDCGSGSYCAFPLSLGNSPFQLCTQACNPVANTGCLSPFACYAREDEHSDCGTPGGFNAGSGCTSAAECVAGLSCINGVCRPLCLRANPGTCGASLACRTISHATGGIWTSYGMCS